MAQRKSASKGSGKGRTTKRSTKKSEAPRRTRSRRAAGDEEVSIDRRRTAERRAKQEASSDSSNQPAPQLERRKKVNRRRQIDPTTCERDYTEDEVEFMNALDDYKRRSGRMFPTCSEVLEVVRGLGYVKVAPAEIEALRGTSDDATSAKPMPSGWAPLLAGADSPADDNRSNSALLEEQQMAY